MRNIFIILPIILAIGYWFKDGARLSFWANKIELREEIPVVDGMPELGTQTKVTWIEKFVCGIETPLIGIFLSLVILLFQIYTKRSLKNIRT